MDAQKAATGTQQAQSQEFPTFCYTNGTSTMNLAQLTTDDNKTCYIQPIGYNYAMINQFQNGANFVAVDGRIQVLNKPMPNTVSSISFKCDVCGAMFSQLGHLNQHKRHHTQDGSGDTVQVTGTGVPGQETITVVTSGGQNFLQGQSIITETGQSLGQIQIVTAESLEAAQAQQQQQQQQHVHQEVTIVQNPMHHHQPQQQQQITSAPTAVVQTTGKVGKGGKCHQCGAPRRKGSKGGKCEGCVKRDQQRTATQIFVDPDGEVKFEISEMDEDIVEEVATEIVADDAATGATVQEVVEVVKKRNSTLVSKCNKCNGTGLIYVEASGSTTNCEANGAHSNETVVDVVVPAGKRTGVVVMKVAGRTGGGGTQQQQQQAENNSVMSLDGSMQPPMDPSGKSGDKPFFCNICGGQFSRYSSLWSHRKLHTGEKNHKCPVCGLAFAKSVYLKNHMRIHTGEKPYRCNTCGMQFSQSPHLKNHERTHSGEKPYVCEVCDKGFARHATLWNHRRIHTGEKPYKCAVCGSAFSQAAHLKNHAKVHSGEKPFKCDICSTAFADRFALKRHRGIHDKYGQTTPKLSGGLVPKQEMAIDEDDEDEEEDDDDPKLELIHHM